MILRSVPRSIIARLKRRPALVAGVRFVRALATPIGRGRLRARSGGAHLFQPATLTRMDRHPVLFALAARQLAGCAVPRLLSFGCSTGEEAFTLARYLPHATIDAIDANPACIARARRAAARSADAARIRFACADAPAALAGEGYEAVFCLSVLRHGDLDAWQPSQCTALMPFARFAAAIEALDRVLRPGGLLILWGCNFRFEDSALAPRYRVLPTPGMRVQPGPFYGPDDGLLPDAATTCFAFVKLR